MKKHFESEWNWQKVLKNPTNHQAERKTYHQQRARPTKIETRPSHWDQVEAGAAGEEAAKALVVGMSAVGLIGFAIRSSVMISFEIN